MEVENSPTHWLDLYASPKYAWQVRSLNDRTRFQRPIGLVESVFDSDGRFWEGRADINNLLELEIRTAFGPDQLRKRVLLAWACLRCKNLLLQAKAITQEESEGLHDVHFVVDLPGTADQAVADARRHIVFLDDHYETVEWQDFWRHCQNASRIVDPTEALARVFVFPLQTTEDGKAMLRFLTIGSHAIWDGLTTSIWLRDLVHFLNEPSARLTQRLQKSLEPEGVIARLPLPQEALYPAISGSKARQRWFWLLTRILRHVRTPLQAGFPNPLYRAQGAKPIALSPTYGKVLDYSRIPPLNTVMCCLDFPEQHTRRLHRLCREAGASIGAGCFALAAIGMMEMHELLLPEIPLADRRPFISGFPLNPRAFFDHKVDPNSCMLAFSDGIALPFLSKDLPVEGRVRLLARQADRQLAAYQKRPRPASAGDRRAVDLQLMGSRGAGRVLATQYLNSLERADGNLPAHLRSHPNPQGSFLTRPNGSLQTCGVSSVGRSLLGEGMYDVNAPLGTMEGEDFVADYRKAYSCVRAREGEFLVGIGGGKAGGLWASISIDASKTDLEKVDQWKGKMMGLLDEPVQERESRL